MKCLFFYAFLFLFSDLQLNSQEVKPNELLLEKSFPNLKFNNPIDFKSSDNESEDLFVAEKIGRIFVFPNTPVVKKATLFLDIRDKVLDEGECGLLGLAFHPKYIENHYFYVNYTTKRPIKTVIARFQTDPDDNYKAIPESFTPLLEFDQPFANHNGGQIIFGPDGFLYIGTGDGGSAGDPAGNSQNRKSLLGKILRIDVDNPKASLAYGIPPKNPYINNKEGFREEIYAWGLRNPWRFSFDRKTKALWCADVGQNQWEEINIIQLNGNYGWNLMEGKHPYKPDPKNKLRLIPPIFEYEHKEGNCSITSGFVYRGQRKSNLQNFYIYGDYCSKRIWQLSIPKYENTFIANAPANINSFGEDNQGDLYILCGDGYIYEFSSNIKAPSDCVIIDEEGGITLFKWVDNSDNETEFVIEMKNKKGKYEALTVLNANLTYYRIKEKLPATIFKIYARNETDYSASIRFSKTSGLKNKN